MAIYRWELPELTITQELITEFQLQRNLRYKACGSQENSGPIREINVIKTESNRREPRELGVKIGAAEMQRDVYWIDSWRR